ncbi:MAG: phosphate ABC transporter permease subunit PstC [Proteobacteria bacterium]|nr:phosphate ABC transporter permease subunit PstC [Pseudomonadota bacterium]
MNGLGSGKRAETTLERLIQGGLVACGLLAIAVTVGIILVLIFETIEFFREVSIVDFFTQTEWTPLFIDKQYGIWPLVSGTILTSVIAISVALPFGLMAAIYLSEFAAPRTRTTVKPALELLAGVPTIVYGFFALTVVTPALQKVVPDLALFNALGPGIVMGIMIIPMISSLSEDAIYSVPVSLREAAYGLGAAKLPTIFRVVVPSAWSGIGAALTLAISRAIGETMIVAVAAGQQARIAIDPRAPIETMTSYIVNVAKGDVPTGTPEYRTIFAVGSMLFVLTLVMNLLSYRLAKRMRERGTR